MSSPSAASSNLLTSLAPKRKTKKKHFVQQKVEVFRASDPVLSVLMWGVNHSMTDLCHVPSPVMLLPDDFKANTKIKVTNHFFNKENLPGQFKFKEYCPQVFRNLREHFGIEDQDFQHVVLFHGSTLLPQFLSMYRVSVENEDTYLLVMRNMFSHRLSLHRKYDLKGSLVSREASCKEKVKELPTFKDIDFKNNLQKIYMDEDEKEKLMDKLNRDIEFLVRLRIMDYSLLLGIHDIERAEREETVEEEEESEEEEEDEENAPVQYSSSPEGIAGYMNSFKPLGPGEFDPYVDVYAIQSAVDSPRREVYFMGLIDVLTQYDTKKKAAHAAKAVKHGAAAEISTVNPEQYAKRFKDFITSIFA
ncbi:phosphatidylinositol 5-phosphate 4-kinase type-2 gamma-like isoform X2 [Periophthalmus magnuspinnatus]|uniref:phosphatidylinositol 5-phosphate 4-kinase type-2 gamma-like isoform X2 n=1 Tax=Periophthalmus magnuspinnatus TaxID=409849 RepID=UPI0024367093|nr:phosphatidylinositol 5-phosphate 4-kinase type-2 gamma-like isoform X2 [Periophthalmus magnuspinnatus]